jgi:GNAT superfamily N-acetyltransferase
MEITIRDFEDWMKPQVAGLFSQQYGVDPKEFTRLMDEFYEHPYQQKKCIRVVAMDGEKVAGFQSFFYWPCEINRKIFNSFQSGNSLVHPEYRNRGIFRKLLEYVDEHKEDFEIDFLLGFPIEVSKNSLIRNGWKNILDLNWYINVSNVFSFLNTNENKKLRTIFKQESSILSHLDTGNLMHVSNDKDFVEWRKNYSSNSNYFFHTYHEGNNSVEFCMKTSRRKKIIRELVIGNILSDHNDPAFIQRGLTDCIHILKSSHCISLISFAQNPACSFLSAEILRESGFKKINKRIYFAVKSFVGPEPVENPSNWMLFRSAIDTW